MYIVVVLMNTEGRRAMIQETRRYLRVEKHVTPELEEDQVTRMKHQPRLINTQHNHIALVLRIDGEATNAMILHQTINDRKV